MGEGKKVSDLRFSHFVARPIINEQFLILVNFKSLVLFAPSEIKRELRKLVISIEVKELIGIKFPNGEKMAS